MGSVTPYVIQGEGYVRVEVNWQDFPHARKCWVYRRLEPVGSPLLMLRDGNAVRLSNGIAVAFDHEAPLDVALMYRSVIAINYNGDFSEGVAEWQDATNNGTVGTVTQSFDYYVAGESNASLKLTPSGAATSKAVSEFIPVTAGQQYTVTGRLMVPDYWTGGIGVAVQWYNGVTPNGTAGAANDFAPFPGVFGSYGFAATAPGGTTQARIVAQIDGTPLPTLPMYAGEMYLTTAGTGVNAPLAVVVQSAGGGWWTDPLHPWTKVRLQVELENSSDLCGGPSGVVYLGLSEKSLPADSTTLEVNDAPAGVGTWNQRKSARSSIRVGTRTAADEAKVKALHASGAPLFFHMNADYGETDFYGLYGDLALGRVHGDQRVPWRIGGVAYAEQLAPVGPAEGTLTARYMDFTKYSTFQASMSANGGAYDDYGRVVVPGGWGSTPVGLPWTIDGTAANASVNGTGVLSNTVLNTYVRARLATVNLADVRVKFTSLITVAPVGSYIRSEVILRFVDASNYYALQLHRQVGGAVDLQITRTLAGVTTNVAAATSATTATASVSISGVFEAVGTALRAKIWTTSLPEAQSFEVSGTDASFATGQVGLAALLPPANSNALPVANNFDDLEVINLSVGGAPTWLDGLQGELVA